MVAGFISTINAENISNDSNISPEFNETILTNQTVNETFCNNDSDCDDGNNLTIDSCFNNTCMYENITLPELNQTINETIICNNNSDCNDNNLSTMDLCINNSCVYEFNLTNITYGCTSDENCSDENNFTLDYCINYSCMHQTIECFNDSQCNDNNESTIDTCFNDTCQYELNQTTKIIPDFLIELMSVLSPSYFFRMFTFGLQGFLSSGATLQARILLTAFQPSTRNAFSASYSANIGFFENTIPANSTIINSHSIYPKLALNGSIINFSISATNADNVWAKIYLPNGTIENLVLVNGGDAYFTAYPVGRYNVTFYANNSLGLTASALDYFDIYSPSPGHPGGGKGTGTTACQYDWHCSPWGNCINKEQKRTCINIGTCTGEEGKPLETQECADLLFDIIIKLNNTELTEGDYLTFDVILKQKKNIENVDVQIKYSIIDKDKDELFSQTETRAVENETAYNKTFDELILNEGEYTLRAEIIYGNQQKAHAEQSFIISGKKLIVIEHKQPQIWIYVTALAVLFIFLMNIITKRKRKKIIIPLKGKKRKRITITSSVPHFLHKKIKF